MGESRPRLSSGLASALMSLLHRKGMLSTDLRYRYDRVPARKSVHDAEARLRGTVWANLSPVVALYRLSSPIGRALGRNGVSANALTYSSLVLALGAGVCAAGAAYVSAAGLLILSGLCDALDGVVARETGTVSRFGALLDSSLDRFADALPLLGLMVPFGRTGFWAAIPALAMVSGFVISYIRARSEALGAELPPLFMRRAERLLLLILSLLLGGVSLRAGAPLLLAGVSVIAVLNLAAVVSALRAAKQALTPDRDAPSDATSSAQ